MIDLDNLQLVTGPNKVLFEKSEPFDFANPPCDPTELAKAMLQVMHKHQGFGLSACQVGIPLQVFVMAGQPNFACFNPKIVALSEEGIDLEEACLSYPGIDANVTRARHIRARFQMPNGEVTTKQFTGMTARVFQHEYDHLHGKIFFDRLSKLKKDMLLKKYHKLHKK